MSIEKTRIRSTLPINLPIKKEDIYSISYSDFISKLKETISSTIATKKTPANKLTPDKLIIPTDVVVPVTIKRPVMNFTELIEYLSMFTNPFLISSADQNAIWSLDTIIEKLFKTNSIMVIKKSTYYCEYCKTQLSNRDVHMEKGEYRVLYAKIRISDDTYFIHSGLEDIVLQISGVNINPDSIFIVQNLGNEKWIMENYIFEKLKEKTIIFPSKPEEKKGSEIIEWFKNVKAISQKELPTKFLSSEFSDEDERLIGENERVEVEIIDHETFEGNIPHCNYCGRRVTKRRLKGVYVRIGSLNFNIFPKNFINISKKDILISKDFRNFPKIPLLECDKCGKIEYGFNEKPCTCGGMMKRNYSYDPYILPLGVYEMIKSVKNRGVLNHREFKHRFLMLALMSELKSNFFSDVFISYTDLKDFDKFKDKDPEVLRISFISKMHGKIHENDIRRFSKLKNILINILNYMEIYGTRDNENILDMWIYSKVERFKVNMEKFIENYDFGKLLRDYENLIMSISRDYMKINRKEKINSGIFNEIVVLSYPFFPSTISSFSQKHQINLNDFRVGRFSVNEMLERFIPDLIEARKRILNLKIKEGIPLSTPLKKLIIEVNFKHIPLLLNIKQNILRYFNAYSIEITEKWMGLEYKVKLKRENLGEIYKPFANMIENVLSKIDAKKMKEEIEKNNYEIGVEGNLITITPQMVEFIYELPKNYEMIDLPNFKIFFDKEVDKKIEDFGVLRKLLRRIASMKKNLKVEYDDYIDLFLSDSKLLRNIIDPYIDRLVEEYKIRKIKFSDKFTASLVMSYNDILEGGIDVGISPVYKKYKIKSLSKLPGITMEDAEKIFSSGFYTINDIRKSNPKEFSDKTKIVLSKTKIVFEYLENIKSFHVLNIKGLNYCPMCEVELLEKVNVCPRCEVHLDWS